MSFDPLVVDLVIPTQPDVRWAAWSPDGKRLVHGYGSSGPRVVPIHDAKTGQELACMSVSSWSFDGAWSPSGLQLWVKTADASNVIYDWPTKNVSANFSGSNISVAWNSAGDEIAYDVDQDIRIADPRSGKQIGRRWVGNTVLRVHWCRDSSLVAGHQFGVTVYRPGREGENHRTDGSRVLAASIHSIVAASDWNEIVVLPLDRNELRIQHHQARIRALTFSHDGTMLFSLDDSGAFAAWSTLDWRHIYSWTTDARGMVASPIEPLIALITPSALEICRFDGTAIPTRESVFYTTAKVALVGDSGVGKTGLGWVLTHADFKEHASTHGEQFWLAERLSKTRSDGTQCEAVIWDLAGQPDYRLIHSLFIDDADVALIIFDPTNRQDPLKGAEFWLRTLRLSNAGRCRTILVGARIDRGSGILTNAEIEDFARLHGVAGGYIATSARTGEGVDKLVRHIEHLIDWEKRPATVTLETFKQIKDHVLEIKFTEATEDVLVTLEQIQYLLAARTGTTYELADISTATKHLADHGYTRNLRNSKGEPFVLLSADLLNNLAASMILEARRNPKGLGALEEARVLKGDYIFTELTSFQPQDQEVLLDAATTLFIDHNVCFRETLGNSTYLIFPSLINQMKAPIDETPTTDGTAYTATGATENVYASLVVLLGYTNTFTRTNQWRNQAQYEMDQGQICGFRLTEEREGEIDLVLYFAENASLSTKLLFQGLFEKFLLARDVSVEIFPPVGCSNCSYVQPRSEVIKRQREQSAGMFCSNCGARVLLSDGILTTPTRDVEPETLDHEQRIAAQRTRFEKSVTWLKSFLRDTRPNADAPTCFLSYAWGDPQEERWVERTLATDLRNAGIHVILDRWQNTPGTSITRFIDQIESADFVAMIGTTRLRLKYDSKTSNPVVAAELKLINTRLRQSEMGEIIPLLLEGTLETSFPPLAKDSVFIDFRHENTYFEGLVDLLLTLYGIDFDNTAMRDLRDTIREENPRRP